MKFNTNKDKKKKEKSKKYYIKLLDHWWSIQIKTHDNYTCVWCGKKHNEIIKKQISKDVFRDSKVMIQAAHIISRKKWSTKWDLDNGISLCAKCHLFTQPNAPVEFTFLMIKLFGYKKLLNLIERSKKKVEYSLDEYIQMCRDRNLLKEK